MRTLTASALAVLVALVAMSVGGEVSAQLFRRDDAGAAALAVWLVGSPVALAAGVLGTLAATALRRAGRLARHTAVLTGALLGLAVALWDPFMHLSSPLLRLWAVAVGGVSGAVWWRVYQDGRPPALTAATPPAPPPPAPPPRA